MTLRQTNNVLTSSFHFVSGLSKKRLYSVF